MIRETSWNEKEKINNWKTTNFPYWNVNNLLLGNTFQFSLHDYVLQGNWEFVFIGFFFVLLLFVFLKDSCYSNVTISFYHIKLSFSFYNGYHLLKWTVG